VRQVSQVSQVSQVKLWRICRKQHASDPLSGRGGLLASGRWHPKGRRIVYTSSTLSLAALEILVHTDRDLLSGDLVQVEIDLPNDVEREVIEPNALPRNWRRYPAPAPLQRLGADWLDRGHTAVLEVPSAVILQENNYLLNPLHPHAHRIRVLTKRRFEFLH